MQKRHWIIIGTALFLGILLASCNTAPNVDWTIEVAGAVDKEITLDYNTLIGLEQVDLADVVMEKSVGDDEIGSWSGPALAGIFEKAGVSDYSSVTATAADGYAIGISKDELQDAIIAVKKDGEWITKAEPDKGPVRLVCPHTPANRWVFQIQRIQVNP